MLLSLLAVRAKDAASGPQITTASQSA
jgi:hypothetical protein